MGKQDPMSTFVYMVIPAQDSKSFINHIFQNLKKDVRKILGDRIASIRSRYWVRGHISRNLICWQSLDWQSGENWIDEF